MSLDDTGHPCTAHFPLLAGALERHICWAFDHAAVGEDDSAAAVLLDVRAVAAEITEDGFPTIDSMLETFKDWLASASRTGAARATFTSWARRTARGTDRA